MAAAPFFLNDPKTVLESNTLTSEPKLPRKRNPPKQTNDESDWYFHVTPQDYHRQQYYDVLDVVSNELSHRSNQKNFNLIADIERQWSRVSCPRIYSIHVCNGSRFEVADERRDFLWQNVMCDISEQWLC